MQFTVSAVTASHNPLGIVFDYVGTESMAGRIIGIAAALGMLLVTAGSAGAAQLYRWVDENGQVHYGDHVPPDQVKLDRQVVNEHGITLKELPRELTADERAEVQRQQAIEEAELKRQRDARKRDIVLLNTYLSVEEIEALRNRRKELLDGQIRVTEVYLTNLREKLTKLQKDASRFQPYNPDPNAPPIHDWLAKELSNTLNSILVYEQTLSDTREKKTELVAKFDNDIDRFRDLKSAN